MLVGEQLIEFLRPGVAYKAENIGLNPDDVKLAINETNDVILEFSNGDSELLLKHDEIMDGSFKYKFNDALSFALCIYRANLELASDTLSGNEGD
jgi:hypothetical protein